MSGHRTIHIGVIAGEASGQLLAADVIGHLMKTMDADIRLSGVGGGELERLGLSSFFDPDDIALTGVTAVVARLPKLLSHLRLTVKKFTADPPDLLLLVDSPDFSSRVAKRIKAQQPHLPIAKYVAPTVWAWRPERAQKMVGVIDHVFSLFPFEPDIMAALGGPPTTYVGHRLLADDELMGIAGARKTRRYHDDKLKLLLLPGSRGSEIKSLLPDMGNAILELENRGHELDITIPAVERHLNLVRDGVLQWPVVSRPKIVTGRAAQLDAFSTADVALAASGTVLLELALADVPAVSIYRIDPMMRPFINMIKVWSPAIPSVIADRAINPEYYDFMIKAGMLARQIEEIAAPNSLKRQTILEGYQIVRDKMALKKPPHETVVEVLQTMLATTRH
ncbi:MAG: lipid-A-disaccharide synthase [Pseudomonadota bacterium]